MPESGLETCRVISQVLRVIFPALGITQVAVMGTSSGALAHGGEQGRAR